MWQKNKCFQSSQTYCGVSQINTNKYKGRYLICIKWGWKHPEGFAVATAVESLLGMNTGWCSVTKPPRNAMLCKTPLPGILQGGLEQHDKVLNIPPTPRASARCLPYGYAGWERREGEELHSLRRKEQKTTKQELHFNSPLFHLLSLQRLDQFWQFPQFFFIQGFLLFP